MKAFFPTLVIAVSLAPTAAFGQERAGDAALGGLSGALVLGPVGAIAGIIVGYTAGPSISRSWGLKRDRRSASRPAPRPAFARSNPAAARQVTSASAAAVKPVVATKPAWDAPPVAGFE